MKKKPFPLMILGAVLLGVVAVFLILSYISKLNSDSQAKLDALEAKMREMAGRPVTVEAPKVEAVKVSTRKVAYARMKIAAGQKISSELYEFKDTPDDLINSSLKENEIEGKFARKNIEMGEPITTNNASDKLPLMSMVITPGYRAMAMQVWNDPAVNSTGGWVNDGDKVDLILTYEDPPQSKQMRTKIMLQNVKVLFMPGAQRNEESQGVFSAAGAPLTVTFEVTPEQAEVLASLEGFGKMRMILRGNYDDHIGKYNGVYTTEVIQDPNLLQKVATKSEGTAAEVAKKVEINKAIAVEKEKAEAARTKKKAEEGREGLNQ
ncbi:Flp pilus assembly protein CpaB [Verrucomicrobia bacterium LW23]|nr:Flp pilus assembly protein CpaB [Verrucomicrobia bacterium LW23]